MNNLFECGVCHRKFKTTRFLTHHTDAAGAADILSHGWCMGEEWCKIYYCNICFQLLGPVLSVTGAVFISTDPKKRDLMMEKRIEKQNKKAEIEFQKQLKKHNEKKTFLLKRIKKYGGKIEMPFY